MLDPQLLRKDLESVKARLATRKFELDADLFTQLENDHVDSLAAISVTWQSA